jgi:hypothetical protein
MRTIVAVFVGVSVGSGLLAAGQWLFSEDRRANSRSAETAKEARVAARDFRGIAADDIRDAKTRDLRIEGELNGLRSDIRALQLRALANDEHPQAEDVEAGVGGDEANFDELRAVQLDLFEQERRDENWASRAEQLFLKDISQSLQKNVSSGLLRSVECRTTHCVATVDWPSFDAVAKEHYVFAKTEMAQNCRVMSYLPSSVERPEDSYSHKVIFKCNQSSMDEG